MGMTTELYPNSHPYIFSEWNLTGQLLYITSYSASPSIGVYDFLISVKDNHSYIKKISWLF